jgi:uncharacterized protein YoxC
MKDWMVICAIAAAAIYIGSCIQSLGNALGISLSEFEKKIDELNEKIDVIIETTNDIEGVVSGRKEKFINPIDL